MLVGRKNKIFGVYRRIKEGDFVYVNKYLNLLNAYAYESIETGYGVVINADFYNDKSHSYLLASSLIGVLINGKIKWYPPDEIIKVGPRNAS